MRKVVLTALAVLGSGLLFVALVIALTAYTWFAARAEPPAAAVARPGVQPRVRTLESPFVWVATVDRQSVKLREADTALLGGETFLTGKPLAEANARIWIPIDRVRALAELASREELEDFDDDDVLIKDDVQQKVEMIEVDEVPAGDSKSLVPEDDKS